MSSRESRTDANDQKETADRQRLRSPLIYETVRREGEEELDRPLDSLWWSGVAAGIALSTSLLSEGLLRFHVPDAPWRPIVTSLGYSVGFLIVILSRLQLFTEQTVTAVLPLFKDLSANRLWRTMRLWGIVLLANLVGTGVTAIITVLAGTVHPEHLPALIEVAQEFADLSARESLVYGVPAGFFIAAIVWMMPNARGSEVAIITMLTYLIGLGGFGHVVVGASEVFLLQITGHLGFLEGTAGKLLPTLVGNIIGGTGLFALLAYGQVHEELDH